MSRLLLIGESWTTITTHQKGFDSFSTVSYEESAVAFKAALRAAGWAVDHLPAHRIGADLPATVDGLRDYDAIVISDVGSNSFLLPPEVFLDSHVRHDPLALLADYVHGGGALLMVGGYMTFTGIEGKARYGVTALADVLPVTLSPYDDRIELPAGGRVETGDAHPGLLLDAPPLLGYNRTTAKPGADVWATIDGDPLIAIADHGAGRCGVFTSDLAPHWASPDFVAWPGYGPMFLALLGALTAPRAA